MTLKTTGYLSSKTNKSTSLNLLVVEESQTHVDDVDGVWQSPIFQTSDPSHSPTP